jgi:hypothetical protein
MPELVKLNHETVQEYLDGEHGISDMLDQRINRVLSDAQMHAPVKTGAYRDSLKVETVHTDRMVKRVSSDVDYALIVEARTGTLARSLDAAAGGS